MSYHIENLSSRTPCVVILEAEPGRARRAYLSAWLDESLGHGACGLSATGDFDEHGAWSGVRDLFSPLVDEIRSAMPELLVKHDYELAIVLPHLRREIKVRNPTLTDVSVGTERVRNYPADRAYRIVHGMIDMLTAWHARSPGRSWVIACDAYDKAGSLVQMFYQELARRSGKRLGLSLLLAVAPGAGEATAAKFAGASVAIRCVNAALSAEALDDLSAEEALRRAEALEAQVGDDMIDIEVNVPALVRYWQRAGHIDKFIRACALAQIFANHNGMYEDALRYREMIAQYMPDIERSHFDRWVAIQSACIISLTALGRSEVALQAAIELAERVKGSRDRVRVYYQLAMLYGRHLPGRDMKKAEEYLDLGLQEIEHLEGPESDRHFLHVFNRNGLAFVRHRQGRLKEAIELCRDGLAELNHHLLPDQHRLHRSVLYYNMAQVYAAIGDWKQAVEHYDRAMEMDPNYSEYYNERGAVFLKAGTLDHALKDFRTAIDLSPPYAESWINLGQCLRLMGRMEDAVTAYSRAIDLDPSRVLALVGRAQAYETLDQTERALADYIAAVDLDPAQPMVLSNIAVLHYSAGRVEEALISLDRAISLVPKMAELYQNRALALSDLGRHDDAARDLRMYLDLAPEAEDRAEVEQQMRQFLAAA
jgi:tetratricopeptide (TPR) repeat protein